jgi:small subunit ribosomal protein S9
VVEESSWLWGTGRNKSAVARVRICKGTGAIKVNGRNLDDYFPTETLRSLVRGPMAATKTESKFDVHANVTGSGVSGQAHAMVLGIARALSKADGALYERLREEGMMTRDSRMKERKKYGRRGARRGFQFSKR